MERSLITHAVKEDKGKLERIVIGKQARIQMTWWLLNMEEVEDEWPGAVDVFHTGRCTSLGERVADALSKGNMREVEDEWPGAVDMSVKKSVVLDRWIQDPRVDRDLARRLLREVQSRVEVQIGMDYTMEMEEMLGEGRLG